MNNDFLKLIQITFRKMRHQIWLIQTEIESKDSSYFKCYKSIRIQGILNLGFLISLIAPLTSQRYFNQIQQGSLDETQVVEPVKFCQTLSTAPHLPTAPPPQLDQNSCLNTYIVNNLKRKLTSHQVILHQTSFSWFIGQQFKSLYVEDW